ncbi:monooxygenase [Burkholderia lata]|uniref:FAD binding domain-containing protein n=1 Tax=Burkholderia lata (strain ATCC 17760 / DSM 23089 / LMG 22485 / NCIMB 9086 / R18194 / 383) TaxID=482957 RepID=UPI001453AA93|nr:FAD binding domain-containing protein [Burkholderia lata]VWC71727.1 monooxygenase [Burkholderia lata]
MNQTVSRRAIVIGGSLGGLFAATTLRAIGWHVDVFERSASELDSRGGGLVLQPDVLDAFRFAGIAHPGALGVPSRDRQFLDASGTVIARQRMPQTQTAWSMLYHTLRRSLPEGVVHAGVALTDVAQDGDYVEATLSNGDRIRADLLIGADGPQSTVRSLLLSGAQPAYAGYVAWRGLVPEATLDPQSTAQLADAFTFQDGVGHQLLTYLIPGDDGSTRPGERRWNWVWYRPLPAGAELDAVLTDRDGGQRTHSIPPGALQDTYRVRLRDDASRRLAPSLAALVQATDAPFMQIIQDYQAPQLVYGRVVLIGDAAFVARPHTGAGSGKAAANAVSLARSLQAHGHSIDSALSEWEAVELRIGQQLAQLGTMLGARIMGSVDARRRA